MNPCKQYHQKLYYCSLSKAVTVVTKSTKKKALSDNEQLNKIRNRYRAQKPKFDTSFESICSGEFINQKSDQFSFFYFGYIGLHDWDDHPEAVFRKVGELRKFCQAKHLGISIEELNQRGKNNENKR